MIYKILYQIFFLSITIISSNAMNKPSLPIILSPDLTSKTPYNSPAIAETSSTNNSNIIATFLKKKITVQANPSLNIEIEEEISKKLTLAMEAQEQYELDNMIKQLHSSANIHEEQK